MSAFILKIIACISMILAHIPFVFPKYRIPLVYIGKLAFPIYAFLIAEEYAQKKDSSKSFTRLLIFAIISQLPACLLFIGHFTLQYFNVFFTLALGLLGIQIYDKIKNKYLSIPLICILAILAEILNFDYGVIGVLMIVTFFIFKESKVKMTLIEILLMFIFYLEKSTHYSYTIANIRYLLFQLLFSISSLLFVAFYNGKRGKNTKRIQIAFYCFYPVHLTLLVILKYFIH